MHAVLRGIDGAAVFFADEDGRLFLEWLGAIAAEEAVALHAYVLMTNHLCRAEPGPRVDGCRAR
jgi:putative transposase